MYFELCEQVEQTNTTQKNKACSTFVGWRWNWTWFLTKLRTNILRRISKSKFLEIQRIDLKTNPKVPSKSEKVSEPGLKVPFKIKNLITMLFTYLWTFPSFLQTYFVFWPPWLKIHWWTDAHNRLVKQKYESETQ